MNILQMVEMVIAAYPQCGSTEVVQVLRSVTDTFCKRSRLLRQRVNVNGTFATDLADLPVDGLGTDWDSPGYTVNVYESLASWDANSLMFFEVTGVQFDEELLVRYPRLANRVWGIRKDQEATLGVTRDRLVVMHYTANGAAGKTALTSSVDIAVEGVCTISPSFAWTTFGITTLPIAEEFHMGIVSGVLQQLAILKDKDIRLAQYHEQQFEKAIVIAKARGNTTTTARGVIRNDV